MISLSLYLMCICVDGMPSKAPSFDQIGKELVSEGDGAMTMEVLDKKIVMTVNSYTSINFWEHDGIKILTRKSSLRFPRCFGSYDYTHSVKLLAVSNEAIRNSAITFYSIDAEYRISAKTHLELGFERGPTVEMRFCPNGMYFAYADFQHRAVKIIATKDFRETASINYGKYIANLFFLTNDLLLTVTTDDEGAVWNVADSSRPVLRFNIPKNEFPIKQIFRHSPTKISLFYQNQRGVGFRFSSIEFDRKITVCHQMFPSLYNGQERMFFMSPKEDYIVVGNSNNELRVLDAHNLSIVKMLRLCAVPQSVAFFEDGRHFAVACLDGHLYSFSVRSKR